MEKEKKTPNQLILTLIIGYCKRHLNKEYEQLCTMTFENLLEENPEIFKRGKPEIWAAGIVWAIGRANFLGDKSFKPYASLEDVCHYFHANTSTVGQKAAKTMEMLDINYFNTDFLREGSGMAEFLNNFVVTKDGFIVAQDISENDDEDENEEFDILEDNGTLQNYTLILESGKKISQADLYQLEFLFRTIIGEDEKKIEIKRLNSRKAAVSYLGDWGSIEKLDEKLLHTHFEITDIGINT